MVYTHDNYKSHKLKKFICYKCLFFPFSNPSPRWRRFLCEVLVSIQVGLFHNLFYDVTGSFKKSEGFLSLISTTQPEDPVNSGIVAVVPDTEL